MGVLDGWQVECVEGGFCGYVFKIVSSYGIQIESAGAGE